MIYFAGPYRGVIGGTLNVAIQPNMNPRKLSIDDWFAEQLWTLDAKNLSAKGGLTVAAQPASFFEHADNSGKVRSRFIYILLHKTDVLSFDYKLGQQDSPDCVAIISSFQVMN